MSRVSTSRRKLIAAPFERGERQSVQWSWSGNAIWRLSKPARWVQSSPNLARWESRVETLLTRLVVRDVSKSGQLICHQRAWKRGQFLSSRRRPDGGHCCAKQDRRTNGRRGCSTVKQLGGNASNDVAAAQIRLARFHAALNLHPRKRLM